MMEKSDELARVRQLVELAKLCSEQHVEAIRHQARLLRARYDALIEEGFTETQSLDIIKSRGLD